MPQQIGVSGPNGASKHRDYPNMPIMVRSAVVPALECKRYPRPPHVLVHVAALFTDGIV